MANQLATIEPIPLPDVRRPAKFSKLPQWVAQRCDTLRKETQPDQAGVRRLVPVLPASLIPTKEQKMLIESHVSELDHVLVMTPEEDIAHGELTMMTVTKMMLVLPSRESGDLVGEAKGEAYMAALEDVPSWAVQEAMRRWHRGECGQKHDYKWQPAPATLRELSMIEVYRVKAIRRQLNDLLLAEPLMDFSTEHCAEMKAKLANPALRSMQ